MGNNNDLNEEIDFKDIFSLLLRFKKIISAFSIFGIIISGLIGVNTKKTWQGEFQIVLETNEDNINKIAADIPIISTENKDELLTEVEILQSPSVLMDIFEYVKSESIPYNEKLRFKKWQKDNLNIFLTKKTSVLNIAYQDTNKDLILPVLRRISLKYQKYSDQKRSRKLKLSDEYLANQIELYKKKSLESIRTAQQFAIDNDLTVLNQAEIDREIPNAININEIRLSASQKIKNIDFQISQLNNLGDDPNKLLYFGRLIDGLNETGLPDKLRTLEEELALNRLTFTEEDPSVKSLIQQRQIIIPIFKKQAFEILNSDKVEAQTALKLAERPKGTLIKYNQLLNDAVKDNATLEKMEDEYRFVLLEISRNQDPWSLITKPTLYPYPIAPRLKIYLIIGIFGGFLFGLVSALLLDKIQDTLNEENELEKLSSCKVLQTLASQKIETWDKSLKFISKCILNKSSGKTLLLLTDKIDKHYFDLIIEKISGFIGLEKFQLSSNEKDLANCSSVILVSFAGKTKRSRFKALIKNISILDLPIVGILNFDRMLISGEK